MRIPLKDRHYLTDAYINKFNLETKPFYNVDPEKKCFVSVRGHTVKINGKYKDGMLHLPFFTVSFCLKYFMSVYVETFPQFLDVILVIGVRDDIKGGC